MKGNRILRALAVLLAATASSVAEMRTWTFESGTTMEAEIVAFPSPQTVKVKRSDGKMFTLPASSLVTADRAYLDAEQARQWKEVSVDKVVGIVAARYKRCAVSGSGVGGQILVALLPTQAEAVLNNRQQQEAQIAELDSRIQADGSASRDENMAAKHGNRAYRNVNRAQARLATQDESEAKFSLTKLKADYAEYVKRTKAATTLLMKNTGLVCEGLPVWECQPLPKRQ